MKKRGLNKVDLIFEKVDLREVLTVAYNMPQAEIIQKVLDSGLKGRGGAGFPTGLKWKYTAAEKDPDKYIVCNADEGEPGTFKDREILDRVAYKVYGGMVIAGKAVGAKTGIVYLRGEYKFLLPQLLAELDEFHRLIKEIGFDFSISYRMGSGAYICGEESALFESIEGFRGEPRNKPPYPTVSGVFGKPTSINNVETLVTALMVIKHGPESYSQLGTKDSRGSKVFSISGDTPTPGIFELELGMTVQAFVNEFGDGDTKAVQVGGASGFCVPRKRFEDTIIGFEGVPTGGSMKLFNSSRSMYNVLHNYLDFFAEESCGQCTPCRVGCQQLLKGVQKVKKGEVKSTYLTELIKLADTMKVASKCGLGQSVGNAFKTIVENFREEIIY
ncbi:MAG TPA: NADH-ubiquinone oxidoreductase-F iron-sulfur binding region domain-containing protein [Bacteroidales bacterium]|jgi:[NiFe] hydrogenase diaphorase moiety large subunit|nr:NADH-ubiquinone oxidoreductase-F iron-sulfur binding region domain-containing protein [Bacteroidales bacterium]HOS70910.1 NADH-ubiquinone oxidoreductase-F iron-sulfur binding region domain-containing protein [Bacteroidales bacterium]HQH23535.1 NADH-ubiquinone oxidoreductase-F iron-sulfur binding region domain-containing protein [Bacteroidales bacterium]HQJ81057.1 NADH-ubiquinone oxidoreductase-F iron-sulfur binding region domain-containing protein [Bacteroidales bacterium]